MHRHAENIEELAKVLPKLEIIETSPTDSLKMTFSDYKDTSPKSGVELFYHNHSKFEDSINLDDEDVEKVEVSSMDSSDLEEIQRNNFFQNTNPQNESIKEWLQRLAAAKKTPENNQPIIQHTEPKPPTVPSIPPKHSNVSRVLNYQDLPYMGEMTLDNSKPRRGRKPKKADICHLIYKNYGTIYPGTPNPSHYTEKLINHQPVLNETNSKHSSTLTGNQEKCKSDVQNRIISSLLERRLTQNEKKRSKATRTSQNNQQQSEPLNLCIRDLNHLKIRLKKNEDNTYKTEIKSEPHSDESEGETVAEAEEEINTSDDRVQEKQIMSYYQRLLENQSSSDIRRPSPATVTKRASSSSSSSSTALMSRRPQQESESPKRASNAAIEKTSAKRKRSAIFIPPIQTETNTNAATEVSICKFKFTGGAKPSLQEKKMLSVDAGGNFRYYSGTGDKSMRGYEFFPREALQQQVIGGEGRSATSSTGAFLQASGEKIYPSPTTTTNEFLLDNPTSLMFGGPQDMQNSHHNLSLPQQQQQQQQQQSHEIIAERQRKRKSRKSLQREKLEKTFKEKGFLIQTQQLESAEGATYCKFRQLRKFTRYLFRSWKDYLPGSVQELQHPDVAHLTPILHDDTEDDGLVISGDGGCCSSRHSSDPGMQ